MPTLDEAGAGNLRSFVLVEMILATGDIRVCSRSTNIDWNGHEWLGLGVLGQVDAVTDGGGEIAGLQFTLAGVAQDNIALARAEQIRWRRVNLYLGSLADDSDAVLWCERRFSGVLDTMHIVDGAESATVQVTAEHIGQTLRRTNLWRYTDSDQRRLTSTLYTGGDSSLVAIADQAQKQIIWPARAWYLK